MKKTLSVLSAAALALSFTVPALASYETEPGGIAASGMALVDGALYIADSYNKVIWKSEGGEARLLAGRCDVKDSSGEPVGGYRDGSFSEARLTGTLGGIISGRLQVPRGTPEKKVYFDSFGLPIFDLSVARAAWLRAKKLGLGTPIPW